jgi:hypothetical protein
VRFCRDCKWVERGWFGRPKPNPVCLHEQSRSARTILEHEKYLVSGRDGRRAPKFCGTMRGGSERCGEEARLYEPASEAQAALEALGG